MNEEPPFLTIDQILTFHHDQLELYGGQDGIRDLGLLQSAIAQPEASFGGKFLHSFPFGMAAAYAFHIAENQPFIDGNKRTALDSALTFLELCGITIDDSDGRLYHAMIDIGLKRLSIDGMEALFKSLIKKSS